MKNNIKGDLRDFKENFNITLNLLNKKDQIKKHKNTDYSKFYKQFIQEELSLNHFNLINRIINDAQNLSDNIKLKYPLQRILYKIVRCLLMSELEIIYLSLFLDKLGWAIQDLNQSENRTKEENSSCSSQEIDFEENLLFISFAVKVSYIYLLIKLNLISELCKFRYWISN